MDKYFDEFDTENANARERRLFDCLPEFLHHAAADCSGLANHLKEVNLDSVNSRDALQALPILRKSALMQAQQSDPPFGGFVRAEALPGTRVFMSPGPVWEPQVGGADPWQCARPLHAAGFRRGDKVHNAFSYHLTPGGFILDEGATALGCTVFPAGVGNTEAQVDAMRHFSPDAFIGTPDYLKIVLDAAAESGKTITCLKRAMVSGGALFPSLREHYEQLGISTRQCYATADLGVIAYETDVNGSCVPGMIVNEGLIVEIVRPGTAEPVAMGDVGEIVVTRQHRDYPLVRFATGDMSRFINEPSPCGRTAPRIAGWLGRADQRTKLKGMFVDPSQLDAVYAVDHRIRRVRLRISRKSDADHAFLAVQLGEDEAVQSLDDAGLLGKIADAFQGATGLSTEVGLVDEALPNDGVLIDDARDYDG